MREELMLRGKKREDILNYFISIVQKESKKNQLEIKTNIESNNQVYEINRSQDTTIRIESSHWNVLIYKETVYILGSLSFPEVKICFEGDTEHVKKIIYEFRVNFLSAGA